MFEQFEKPKFYCTVIHLYGNWELVSFFMRKFDNLSEQAPHLRQSNRENRSPRTLRPPYITFQIISRQNDMASTAS